jgi:hypothetical protein
MSFGDGESELFSLHSFISRPDPSPPTAWNHPLPCSTLMKRLLEIDIFRGLLLVIMVINHTPSPIREATTQPLGFVSAAEAFVFVSACLCGLIFSRKSKAAAWWN